MNYLTYFLSFIPIIHASNIIFNDPINGNYVLDDLLNTRSLKSLHKFIFSQPMSFNPDRENNTKAGFTAELTNQKIYRSNFVKKIKEEAKELFNIKENDLHIAHLTGQIFERGDFNSIQHHCRKEDSTLLAFVVLSEKWLKNSYGDFSIYDQDGEIIKSFQPRHGRTFFVKCETYFKFWPPSMGLEKRLHLFQLEFSKVKPTDVIKQLPIGNTEYLKNNLPESLFMKYFKELDLNKYLTKKLITKNHKRIYVYDGLFDEMFMSALFHYVVEHTPYYEEEIDDASDDQVRWILGLEDPNFIKGPIWAVLKQILSNITGISTYTPYDVSVNHIRRTDGTTIHKDCKPNQNELTNLIYLNPGWNADLHGETVFLDADEFIISVVPKFGRLVVFDGDIDHSARPPSPNVHGARYTFAIKTAVDEKTAKRRTREMNGE